MALAMIGDRADALGTPLRLLLPELAGQELVERVEEVFATGRPVLDREWRVLVDTDGDGELEELYVAVSVVPSRAPGGTVTGIVAQTTDVTAGVRERRAAASEIEALGRRYARARDVVSELQRSVHRAGA